MMYVGGAGDGLNSGFKGACSCPCQSVSQSFWLSFGALQHNEEEDGGY